MSGHRLRHQRDRCSSIIGENHADVVLYDSSDKLTGEDLKAKLPEGSRAACIAGELPEMWS